MTKSLAYLIRTIQPDKTRPRKKIISAVAGTVAMSPLAPHGAIGEVESSAIMQQSRLNTLRSHRRSVVSQFENCQPLSRRLFILRQ